MSNRNRLLLTGAVTLLAGLVIMLPARVLHHFLSPDVLRLAGIEGSAWHGRAAEAQLGGIYMRNLRWSLRPLSLLTGRVGYTIEVEPTGGFLETDLAVSVTGTLSVDTLRAALSLDALGTVLPLGGAAGDVTLQFDDVRIEDGWPTRLRGEIVVAGLLVPTVAAQPLGDFRAADFEITDDAIVGRVEDVSGVLDLVDAALTLTRDLSWSLIGLVKATPAAAPSVVEQLRLLGTPDARGLRVFRPEGRFIIEDML